MKQIRILILALAVPYLALSQEVPDSTPAFVKTWILTEDFTTIQDFHFDTIQTGFQIFNPVYRNSISNAYLGNLGLQSRNNLYFNNDRQPGFFFLSPYIPYLYTPEKTMYYNITKPFTMLEYYTTSTGGVKEEKEEVFHAVHTQNINPYLNMGFDLRLLSSGGKYANQKGKVTNFTFFGSRTGKDYTVHSSFHFNGFNAQENGGLNGDSLFINSDKEENEYDVNLEEATSGIRSITYHLTQRYRFGKMTEVEDSTSKTGFSRLRDKTAKTGSIVHTLVYDRGYREYLDPLAGSNPDFYPAFYIDSIETYDSTFYRSLTNTLQLMLDENPNRDHDFGARVFVSHEWVRYAYNTAPDSSFRGNDTIVADNKSWQYGNVQIGASVLHTVGTDWNWVFQGRFYPLGYRAGDLILKGEITRVFQGKPGESRIRISGEMSIEEPDHFTEHYESNHYKWDNEFRKVKEIHGSLQVSNEAISLSAHADMSLISGCVYFNQQALPVQYNPAITLIGFDVGKKFRLGPFHSDHRAEYLFISNRDVVRMPDLSYYTSDYFAFPLVRNVLNVELGFDLYYYTKYRGLAYAPSSAVFYAQEIREIGNYPYMNLFMTAKLKRTRFYIRWDHVYAGMIKKNYFHVLNYPTPGKVFRFGLSWTFYD